MNETDRGFTLIEMLVVMLITALVISAALVFHGGRGTGLRTLALQLAAELNSARADAIARDQPVEVVIERGGQKYRAGRDRVTLPDRVRIGFESTQAINRSETGPRLIFFPDGSSTGGLFKLAESGRAFLVRVDWMSGAVTFERGAS